MINAAISIQAKTGRRMEKSASDAIDEPWRAEMARWVSDLSMVRAGSGWRPKTYSA
jgi:hypothetical protein